MYKYRYDVCLKSDVKSIQQNTCLLLSLILFIFISFPALFIYFDIHGPRAAREQWMFHVMCRASIIKSFRVSDAWILLDNKPKN